MRYFLLAAALLFSFTPLSSADGTAPSDFAYGIYLETPGDYPVYEMKLPPEVYKAMTRADLGDVCVFNSSGEVVPFMLKTQAPAEETGRQKIMLARFPITGEPDKGLAGVSMQVKRDDKGSIINVTTSEPGAKAGQALMAYLLDAGRVEEPVASLELDCGDMPEGGMARLNVEYSNDLQRWYPAVSGATVAKLSYGGHSLNVNEIKLNGTNGKFYRITPYGGGRMIELNSVTAVLAKRTVEPDRNWLGVQAVRTDAETEEYSFDTTGRMPVDRLRVRLPQRNTMVQAEFLSRAAPKNRWLHRGKSLVYGLQLDGTRLDSPDVRFAPNTDMQWLMRIMPGSGGLGSGEPYVELGWVPHSVVFVARGASPFLLAYGSGRTFPNTGNAGYLLAKVDELDRKNSAVVQAGPGEKVVLGGDAALSAEIPPFNLKKLALWAILLTGVGILALMAFTLYRRMRQADEGS